MKVLLTGVSGQLGFDVAKVLKSREIEYWGVSSKELDIRDEVAVKNAIHSYMPDVVIHCAAYTKVDQAQDEAQSALKVNVHGTANITQACRETGADMMYISTDYVFSGNGTEPFQVDSPTGPLNQYGTTKLMGELVVKEALRNYYIVRTSWVIGIHGNNFVKTMLHLSETQNTLSVVEDQIGSPTFTRDLAPLLCDMIQSKKYGIYHATNEGYCSWAEFTREIMRLSGRDVFVKGITTEEYGAKACRPLNSRLSKESLDAAGFSRLPDWKLSLQVFLCEYCAKEMKSRAGQISTLSDELAVERKVCQKARDDLEAERIYYGHLKLSYDTVINSNAWRATKPVRVTLDKLKQYNTFMSFYQFLHRFKHNWQSQNKQLPENAERTLNAYDIIAGTKRVVILATRHTLFIARLIENCLNRVGVETSVLTEEPEQYEHVPHIVLCPNIWQRMPSFYISVQMEQTISSRWFTDEYYNKLSNSFAILDYSLVNVSYFKRNTGYGKMFYYVPVDYLPGLRQPDGEYEYDVVFYGDPNNPRRKKMLEELKKDFNVLVLSEVFGDELYDKLSRAKIVVNLHYYDNSMLETTRLYEVLSLGRAVIVSERSSDPHEEERLEDYVDFVDCNDIQGVKERISYWLSHEEERLETVRRRDEGLSKRPNAFEYYFYRFMLAHEWITFDQFYQIAGSYVSFGTDRICLSLPEDTDRRADFDRDNRFGFEVMPGLRHYRGWTGCGLSYKFIMKKAQEQGFANIVVCEDDVFFPDDFETRFDCAMKYLSTLPSWDVFQGLMANIGDVKLSRVDRRDGQTYVHLDHMISMVFNVYNKRVFKYLIGWDERDPDVMRNTIDRALEVKKLKIVAAAPFLVGHKEDMHSSIWNFDNTTYSNMIAESSERLEQLIEEYERK